MEAFKVKSYHSHISISAFSDEYAEEGNYKPEAPPGGDYDGSYGGPATGDTSYAMDTYHAPGSDNFGASSSAYGDYGNYDDFGGGYN